MTFFSSKLSSLLLEASVDLLIVVTIADRPSYTTISTARFIDKAFARNGYGR